MILMLLLAIKLRRPGTNIKRRILDLLGRPSHPDIAYRAFISFSATSFTGGADRRSHDVLEINVLRRALPVFRGRTGDIYSSLAGCVAVHAQSIETPINHGRSLPVVTAVLFALAPAPRVDPAATKVVGVNRSRLEVRHAFSRPSRNSLP